MKPSADKLSRREQILQSLAQMLESPSGKRITTAALARDVGVSEAALYRHFPSKFKMFEGLLDFVEESIFSRVNQISAENRPTEERLQKIISLMLGFAEKNPGICRILSGEAISTENERLAARVNQIFDRLETQLRQLIRQAELTEGLRAATTVSATASVLMGYTEGKIRRYVRSDFAHNPGDAWQQEWSLLRQGLFVAVPDLGS
jgi:TetR/AcrR family transcriptional regulator